MVEVYFPHYSAIDAVDRIVLKHLFEFIREIEESAFFCDPDGPAIANEIDAEFVGVIETLNAYPSPNPLFKSRERRRSAGRTFALPVRDEVIANGTAVLVANNVIEVKYRGYMSQTPSLQAP